MWIFKAKSSMNYELSTNIYYIYKYTYMLSKISNNNDKFNTNKKFKPNFKYAKIIIRKFTIPQFFIRMKSTDITLVFKWRLLAYKISHEEHWYAFIGIEMVGNMQSTKCRVQNFKCFLKNAIYNFSIWLLKFFYIEEHFLTCIKKCI